MAETSGDDAVGLELVRWEGLVELRIRLSHALWIELFYGSVLQMDNIHTYMCTSMHSSTFYQPFSLSPFTTVFILCTLYISCSQTVRGEEEEEEEEEEGGEEREEVEDAVKEEEEREEGERGRVKAVKAKAETSRRRFTLREELAEVKSVFESQASGEEKTSQIHKKYHQLVRVGNG